MTSDSDRIHVKYPQLARPFPTDRKYELYLIKKPTSKPVHNYDNYCYACTTNITTLL